MRHTHTTHTHTQLAIAPFGGDNHTRINHDAFGMFGNAVDSLVAPRGTGALYAAIEEGVATFCLASAPVVMIAQP